MVGIQRHDPRYHMARLAEELVSTPTFTIPNYTRENKNKFYVPKKKERKDTSSSQISCIKILPVSLLF